MFNNAIFACQGVLNLPYSIIKRECECYDKKGQLESLSYTISIRYVDDDKWDFLVQINDIYNIDKLSVSEGYYYGLVDLIISHEIDQYIKRGETYHLSYKSVLKMELFL